MIEAGMRIDGQRRRVATMATIAALLFVAAPALGQQPPVGYVQSNQGLQPQNDGAGVRLRPQRERGIKLGNFRLWPSLLIEARWDSNVFQQAPEETPTNAPIMRIVPGLALSNPEPDKFGLTFGVETDVRLFLSGDETLKSMQNFGAKADLKLDIMPKAPVSFTIYDAFRRSLVNPNFSTSNSYNQNFNNVGATLNIHPGAGALNIGLTYGFVFNKFDDFTEGNYLYHDAKLSATWRFYPKTVAFFEADAQFRQWDEASRSGLPNVNSKPLRIVLGLNGYFTKKIAALAKIGYGNSFHEDGPSYNNVLAQAEIVYKPIPTILLATGYARDFSESFYGNFYSEDRAYLRTQFDIVQRVVIDAGAAFHYLSYPEFDPGKLRPGTQVSSTTRRDKAVSGNISVSVDIVRWIGLTVGYEVRSVFTDFFVRDVSSGKANADLGKYTKHQVYGSVNVRY